jgi:phosphotransferase system  glucose/maltose/N-acetylglucosamine-specific IIC component
MKIFVTYSATLAIVSTAKKEKRKKNSSFFYSTDSVL